ncbi:MAG: polA [Candidatus Doudnabacteria bacterium]|nr:polA [Candidatus Doudnabacteria bacterium]
MATTTGTKTKKNSKKYMLVDGNALVHRAFHAIQHLSTKSGEPTNAVYGFAVILLKAIKDLNPTHIALTFDLASPTFRHEKYKEYKGTRVKAADELYAQFPRIKEVVKNLGIPIYEMKGFEADDMLGTLAQKIQEENKATDFEVFIVTGDLDTLQLVTDHVKIYAAVQGLADARIYNKEAIFERYGIKPSQILDFKAIKGDPSDNIPGAPGIGEKGALDLVKEFGSLENIFKNLDKVKAKAKKYSVFETDREQIEMSYDLSKIICDVPIDFNFLPYKFSEINYEVIVQIFQELEFKSLIPKLPKVEGRKELSAEDAVKIEAKKSDKYYLIDTAEKLHQLSTNLLKQKEFAFDTENEGLGALEFDLVGISFSYAEGEAYYVPASLLLVNDFDGLRKVFSDPKIGKIAHNIKYDYLVLKQFGIEVKNLYFDTMIASYLLAPGSRTHDLDSLAFNEFGYQMQPIAELIGKGKDQGNMRDVPLDKITFYGCEDVDYTFRLKKILLPRLEQENLLDVFFKIEMPLILILAEIEENGILLDIPLFKRLEKEVQKEINKLEKKIHELAGEEFNINSPTQMKVILFDKMELQKQVGFIKKTKTGYSTAASELEKMRGLHPIIDAISGYRELTKLQSTYITTLPSQVSKKDGRLHTNYNQTIASTGRLSSTNPNLQNIPVGSSGVASEIRKGFIAAPGNLLLAVDYSQIELRVVAHLSGDKTMTEVFKSNEDIHTATAMQLYDIRDASKITKEMRRDAKTINFGVLYGVSSFGLSERVAMNRAEAADFIKKYFQRFPSVEKYLKVVIEEAKKSGYVINEAGRKLYMPELNSSQFMVRAAAERAAINMPIQSLAADILKIAMQNVVKEINIQSEEIKLLLQVHDELVFEVKKGTEEKYAKQIKEIMQNAYKLNVPLVAESKVGQNWGEMN